MMTVKIWILFQIVNEHTRLKDSSGKEMRVIDVFKLAFQSILSDFLKRISLAELMRKLLVVPSAWNENTQLFLKKAASEVTWK